MTRRLFAVTAVLTALAAAPAAAQEPVPPDTLQVVEVEPGTPVVELAEDTVVRTGPRPRSVFIRAMVVPGWGHASIGEYRRGSVYFALQASSWAMLIKTVNKLNDVRDRERGLARIVRDSLDARIAADTALARELEDPFAYAEKLEEDMVAYPGIPEARRLIVSRRRHRQDWIVYTVVTTFASAIDAYVTAHLSDFPREVTTLPTADGGVEVSIRVPIGAKR